MESNFVCKVDTSLNDSIFDGLHAPDSIGSKRIKIVDINVEPMAQCGFSDPPNSNTVVEPIEPVIGKQLTKDQEENFPTYIPLVPVQATSSAVDKHVLASSEHANEKTVVDQTLMKELEEMGIKLEDAKIVYEYNLKMQSLHDIHGAALEELDALGYKDRELNKQLLVKHNGSMKHVYRDLLARDIILLCSGYIYPSIPCDVGNELDFLGSSPCMNANQD